MLHMNKHTLWTTMSVKFQTLLQLNELYLDRFPEQFLGINERFFDSELFRTSCFFLRYVCCTSKEM